MSSAPHDKKAPGTFLRGTFLLVPPHVSLKWSYLQGLAELQNEGWLWYADFNLAAIAEDFAGYLRAVEAARTYRQGEIVPETELWVYSTANLRGAFRFVTN